MTIASHTLSTPPPRPATPAADRRIAPRQAVRKLTTIALVAGEGRERVPACIVDFSATGLGLVVARPLASGQRFELGLREGRNLTCFRYAVTRCEPLNGCHRVGAVLLEVAAAQGGRRPAITRVQRAVARLRKATGS